MTIKERLLGYWLRACTFIGIHHWWSIGIVLAVFLYLCGIYIFLACAAVIAAIIFIMYQLPENDDDWFDPRGPKAS